MDNQNLVVTVRLSDVEEKDQPDPICLPVEELATWRHFEALLQNMYQNPPPAIRVCYLDDESDWIELSSDSELKEAIRVAQDTDEILQLQVKRQDAPAHTYFESTLSCPGQNCDSEEPHVTPLQTTYYNVDKETLEYPYPRNTHNNFTNYNAPTCPDSQNGASTLIYPHPKPDTSVDRPNDNVLVVEANGRSAFINNRPDLSTEEKVQRLKTRLASPKGGEEKGLNTCLFFNNETQIWQQASKYSSEDKLKFMKSLAKGDSKEITANPEEKSVKQKDRQIENKSELLIEPLSEKSTGSSSALAVQDPFEVICQDKPSRDLEQIQLNMHLGNILKPQKPKVSKESCEEAEGCVLKTATTVNIERVIEQAHASVKPSLVKNNNGGHNVATRSSSSLVEVSPPVPMPRTLQMMEGAQSGANAVAIEIPEGYHHGAAQKEEDVTASGGAACTSASAETGEAIGSRPGHDGAAVSHKVKGTPERRCGEAATVQPPEASRNRSSSKKGKKSEPSKPKKKKEVVPKDKSTKRRSSSAHGRKRREDLVKDDPKSVKVEADVESGEKVVKSGETTLQYLDFTTYMSRMKDDLHCSIVRGVAKETHKLLRKTLSRSASYDPSLIQMKDGDYEVIHRNIYCDVCNRCIRGIRYKCGNCADFDLCAKCEATANTHDQGHVFLKLYRPAYTAGWFGNEKLPLLRDIIYKNDSSPTSAVVDEDLNKDQSLKDVPILSIEEVTTPGPNQSPLNTPSEPHKVESNNWVWDSTFDVNHKLLYPQEGEAHDQSGMPFDQSTPCKEGVDGSSRLSESEISRLITLLSFEEETARRVDKTITTDSGEVEEMCQRNESTQLSLPLTVIGPSIPRENVAKDAEAPKEEEGETNDGEDADSMENHHSQEDKDSHCSMEFMDVNMDDADSDDDDDDEDFEELKSDHSGDEEEGAQELQLCVARHRHSRHGDHCDSDTSDDFCILDPPSRDECEACIVEFPVLGSVKSQGSEEESKHELDVPSSEPVVESAEVEREAAGIVANDIVPDAEVCEPCQEEERVKASYEELPGTQEESQFEEKVDDAEDQVESDKSESKVDENGNDEDDKNDTATAESVDGEREEEEEEEEESSPENMTDFDQEDVLANMSVEERRRFLEMVKGLKERAEDLEQELRIRKEAEAKEQQVKEEEVQYQMILEEKQREAARENEKLDELKKKEHEEKVKRHRQMEKERRTRQKQKEMMRQNAGANKKRLGSHGCSPTLMQMALNQREQRAGKAEEKAEVSQPKPIAEQPKVYYSSEKKDANCQTGNSAGGADAAAQASQMIQTVASGVTKAAEAAFHTAKDVFYSLQAKQVDKKGHQGVAYSKTPSSDTTGQKEENVWTPPSSVWTPPADTYVPPKSNWTPPSPSWKPPHSNWMPPKSEWTGPKSAWTPPKTEWAPPAGFHQTPPLESETSSGTETKSEKTSHHHHQKRDNVRQNANGLSKDEETPVKQCDQPEVVRMSVDQESSSAAPVPPIQPTQITDPVLRREVQGMQILIEMGFANREENRRLLQLYNGDVEKAVQSLLQEERGEHWAWQRH